MNHGIAERRILNQLIASTGRHTPGDVVRRLGMLQAQDYLGSLWAVGLRCQNRNEAEIEKALAERKIVRTWPARGTLHYVAPEDARWMLALLNPRIFAKTKGRYRQLGLDDETFEKSRKVVARALQGGNQLTREELYRALDTSGISSEGQRGIHILGRMAQEGLVCFGPRRGKQQTIVLLEEWLPAVKPLDHDQALTEIVRRYFIGHGPAMLQDFVWWSGLTVADAKAGLEMAGEDLDKIDIEGQIYWQSRNQQPAKPISNGLFLLPPFDEYLVGYRDRGAVLNQQFALQYNAGGGMLNAVIVVGAIVAGTWKRVIQKNTILIKPSWFTPPTQDQSEAFAAAARLYGSFLDLPVTIA